MVLPRKQSDCNQQSRVMVDDSPGGSGWVVPVATLMGPESGVFARRQSNVECPLSSPRLATVLPTGRPVMDGEADRIGPSTTGLPTCVHRGGWWVKVDVIGKLRSGWAGAL